MWRAGRHPRLGTPAGAGSADPDAGLLPAISALDGPGFDSAALAGPVRDFYERTAGYRLEVWSQWAPWAWPFGWLVTALFARRLHQLALPLRPLDTAYGMTSEVVPAADDKGSRGTLWYRRLRSTGATVYSGWYGTAELPGAAGACVTVSFPLPNGRLVVLLRPAVGRGGSLVLRSGRGRWGDPGAYLVVHTRTGAVRARRVPLHEGFRVFADTEGVLRTDHALRLWSLPVLRLHYAMVRTR